MALALYMDHHVPGAVTDQLRLRGVDVITALEDGGSELSDSELLNRATELNRLLVTQDEDFLSEAAHRQLNGVAFFGIVYAHQLKIGIGAFVGDLELIAKTGNPDEFENRVEFLPL